MIAGERCRLGLVVPCYNESVRLDVDRFRRYLAHSDVARIVFVDDGSRDGTREVLERLCQGYEARAEVLSLDGNRGKAEAVRIGVMHAMDTLRPELVGYWDADLSTPLETIERFLRLLDEQAHIEMVFGSRVKLLGRLVERRAVRHYLGRNFATVVSVMLRLPIYDTQCGAKLFRVKRETREVFATPFISRWVFDVEILARLIRMYGGDSTRLANVIYEYPLEVWTDVPGSKLRARDFLLALIDLARIKYTYLS